MKAIRAGLLIGLILTMSVACASTGAAPSPGTTYTTLMAGWEHHFRIDWTAADQSPGARTVSGYVSNQNGDRKSTRLNSSHVSISYAVFCLKKKKNTHIFRAH